MPRTFPLAAVLAVRQQKEDAEERALVSLGTQIQQMHTAIARVEHELVQHTAGRAHEVNVLHNGAHHQANHARWTMLHQAKLQLSAELKALEARRAEQQTRYLRARADREMLTELRQTQRTAWEAELQTREAKRMADLFTARRLRG